MKLLRTLGIFLVLALVPPVYFASAQDAFVIYPEGIVGGSTVKGYLGASEIAGYLHEVNVPYDDRGVISGPIEHAPVHFTKRVDSASPALLRVASTGKHMEQLAFEFTRTMEDGRIEIHYGVTLENVYLVRAGTFLANPEELEGFAMLETPTSGSELLETVSAVYERITRRVYDPEKGEMIDEYTWSVEEQVSGRTGEARRSELAATVFPNPFNVSATLVVDLPAAPGDDRVEIQIFDALGREVKRVEMDGNAGTGRYVWDATDEAGRAVPSGIYIYRVRNGQASASGGMTLIK